MSKTRWSVLTALILTVGSGAVYVARTALGGDIYRPPGTSTWKVTLLVSGQLLSPDASLTTLRPPDFRKQHVLDEHYHSAQLIQRSSLTTDPHRSEVTWRRLTMNRENPFRLTYSFRCVIGMKPTEAMSRRTRELDAPPEGGALLKASPRIESDHKEIAAVAKEVIKEDAAPIDQARSLFEYVDRLKNEPTVDVQGALDCLRAGRGNPGGKSRLLVALCRNRGLPARLHSGLVLGGGHEQGLHRWAEVWVNDQWLPMCPTIHHFGSRTFPNSYLVLHVGEEEPIRGHGVQFDYRFLIQTLHTGEESADDSPLSANQRFWRAVSLYTLPPAEQHVIRFLLLLPLASLIVSVFRTVIGVPTFGTFGPALLGLAFLNFRALPLGLGIFVATVLIGWAMRHLLDRYHLLLVPRTSILLTLIVLFLVGVIMVASHYEMLSAQYIALFPLVILTHLVERFWTIEAEDGVPASFKTLLGTLGVSALVSLALGPDVVGTWVLRYPETLGVVLAAQFLLGRYMGYRVSELYRFSDLLPQPHALERTS